MMTVLKGKAIKDKSRRPGRGGADSDGDEKAKSENEGRAAEPEELPARHDAEDVEPEAGEEERPAEDACIEEDSVPNAD